MNREARIVFSDIVARAAAEDAFVVDRGWQLKKQSKAEKLLVLVRKQGPE